MAHVVRYQPYTKRLMALVGDGAIGGVVDVDHLERIGDLHIAHSYVRGNWRQEDLAPSALMSKSCHDIDWIAAVVGRPAVRVASFGSLHHFREGVAPHGSGSRCLSCGVEPHCAFSAKRFYLGALADPDGWRWPLSVVADAPSEEAVLAALESGPYGRCVYRCDNDVVDHQVVIVEFDGGATASFTMSAFTEQGHRRLQIGGTRGHLEGDGERIRHFDYLTRTTATYELEASRGSSAADGHGGGDGGSSPTSSLPSATETGPPSPRTPGRAARPTRPSGPRSRRVAGEPLSRSMPWRLPVRVRGSAMRIGRAVCDA